METIKEIYFKEMSGDVFLCSPFAKAVNNPPSALQDCREGVLYVLPQGVCFLHSALHPHPSGLVPYRGES